MLIYAAREKMVMQYFMSKLSKKTALRGCHFLKKLLCNKGSINISGFYTYFSLSVLRVCDWTSLRILCLYSAMWFSYAKYYYVNV